MRNTFSKKFTKLVQKDKDIMLILADLGYTVFEDIEKNYPDQIINVGIAEQDMVGVAAGLALLGRKPVIYSIVPFVSMRCFEQIRDDICYHELDVKVIGIGAGFSYSSCGPTHHAVEDLIVMASLPGMRVICPANSVEVEDAMKFAFNNKGPVYISLAKKPSFDLEMKKISDFTYQIFDGEEIALIANGTILKNAYLAAQELRKEGINVSLYSMAFIKPFDRKVMKGILMKHKYIFTLQEQNLVGGLASCVANVIAENSLGGKVLTKFGVDDKYVHEVGGIDFYETQYGLDKDNIKKTILNTIKEINL